MWDAAQMNWDMQMQVLLAVLPPVFVILGAIALVGPKMIAAREMQRRQPVRVKAVKQPVAANR